MTDFELVDADHLDYDAFTTLQKEAYASLLTKLKVSNTYMNPEFYKWKFHPPMGNAKIVLVREGTQIVSTNTMIPVDMRLGNMMITGWQACDAATKNGYRGKGYSSGCLHTLSQTLKTNEVLFLFPNENSVRYVEDRGFLNKGIIATWVHPSFMKKNGSPNVTKITCFDKNQNRLAQQLIDHNKATISRSAEYLNWRYCTHPITKYDCFVYKVEDEPQGFCVIRKAEVMGHSMTVVMELWGISVSVKKALLQSVAEWTFKQHIKWIVLQDNALTIFSGLRMGFLYVPTWFVPKKQVLMVFVSPGNMSKKVKNHAWWIQSGDWDGL